MLVVFREKVVFFKKYDIILIFVYGLIVPYKPAAFSRIRQVFKLVPHGGGMRGTDMKHIKTINKANLSETAKKGGCGKCQASCQSACKTSCTVGNQKCASEDDK